MSRLAPMMLALLVPAAAAAQLPSNACIIELNQVDESFDRTHALLKEANSGDIAQKCAAVARHLEALVKGVDVYQRCIPAGPDREDNVASLSGNIVSFRDIQTGLKCAGELVPARFTPIGAGR